MIGLSDYAIIKNNYCICYFGYADEYLVQLKVLRPVLEARFPGLNIYLGCKDEAIRHLENSDRVIKLSEIKVHKPKFAYIREIRFDGTTHPIESLLKESKVHSYPICDPQPPVTKLCVIVKDGVFPTNSLTDQQVQTLKRHAIEKGYDWIVGTEVKGAGWVAGVESPTLFEAAAKGIPTSLVPTGLGTRLYKTMFPNSQILNI